MKLFLEDIIISLEDIKLLKKNRRTYNLYTNKNNILHYSVELKNGCIYELTKHEYKLIKKRLGEDK